MMPLNLWGRLRTSLATLAVVAGAFFGLAVEQAFAGRVISNGTVALGVNDTAQLNFGDVDRFVGVTYEPTDNDGTRAGCECEGWGAGVADPGGNFSGSANNDVTGPSGANLDLVSFASTASTATSIVSIDDQLRVTHAFAPSPSTPNLYEIKVTLENIGATALPDVRYTRLMDWDVEPTEFEEFVTIQGADPQPGSLLYSNDNGFEDSDPFDDHSPLDPATENADYTDKGPDDHGALFDFGFGALAVGQKKEFSIFYGAAANETAANAAVSAVGAELFSYGQPDGGQVTGAPNTFIWGFKAVGGTPVIPPTLTLTPSVATNPVGTSHTATAELKNSSGNPVPGAPIVFKVSGANPQPATTRTTGANGKATFTYTGTSTGGDTIKACLDNNGNDNCDLDEVTDTAKKTWGSGGSAGVRIAFASNRTGGGDVYSMRANGSDQRRLTTHPAFDGFPGFASGGGRLAFASNRTANGDIYSMKADGSAQTRLTTNAALSSSPAWSSDGKKIAVASKRTGNGDIYLLQGTGRQRLTRGSARDTEPSWSPDGTKIAFASNRTGNGDIYVMNADGTGLTRLTRNPAKDSSPDWSPFGHLITFASKRTGNGDIYSMDGNGSGQTRLTTGPAVDSSPDAP